MDAFIQSQLNEIQQMDISLVEKINQSKIIFFSRLL